MTNDRRRAGSCAAALLLAHWGGGVLRAVMLPDVDFTGTAPVDLGDGATLLTLADGTKLDGVASLRNSMVRYSDQFVRVVAEKLLTYALGRDMARGLLPPGFSRSASFRERQSGCAGLVVACVPDG